MSLWKIVRNCFQAWTEAAYASKRASDALLKATEEGAQVRQQELLKASLEAETAGLRRDMVRSITDSEGGVS
jgi:hypothetical protein